MHKNLIDKYLKVGYNIDMTYVKKEERYKKLRERFVENCSGRWSEYEFLGEYSNKDTKTLFRHKACGREFQMTPHNFKAGHGCPECAKKHRAESLKKTKGSAFLSFLEGRNDYVLLSPYINNTTRVRLKHSVCGAEFSFLPGRYNTIKTQERVCLCPKCNLDRLKKKFSYSLAQANNRLSETNPKYKFLSYAGAHAQAELIHKECGTKFIGKAYYFLNGSGYCPKCTTRISKMEREIYEWFQSVSPDAEQSVHDIPEVSELDMLDRKRGVAIEYNGHYWHSLQALTKEDPKTGGPRMAVAEAKKYHYLKSFWCEKQGIRLIHIWDYEWNDPKKQAILKNIILGALGMLPERYYARECEVHRYNPGDARWRELNQFFENNNIQGNRGGRFVYTLEKNGRILMAYKFGRPSGGRAKKLYEYEMVRGAAAPGVQVIGGATRLWAHFVREVRPNNVVYYVDYNYFDGRSVEKLGGKFIGSQPGVKNYWVKEEKVKNREPAHHQKVKEAIANGDVLELWNAGTKTYTFTF